MARFGRGRDVAATSQGPETVCLGPSLGFGHREGRLYCLVRVRIDWRAKKALTAMTTQLRRVKPSLAPSMIVRTPMTAKATRNHDALVLLTLHSLVDGSGDSGGQA